MSGRKPGRRVEATGPRFGAWNEPGCVTCNPPACETCGGTGVIDVSRCTCAYPDTGAQNQHEPYCGLEPCPNGCPIVTAPSAH